MGAVKKNIFAFSTSDPRLFRCFIQRNMIDFFSFFIQRDLIFESCSKGSCHISAKTDGPEPMATTIRPTLHTFPKRTYKQPVQKILFFYLPASDLGNQQRFSDTLSNLLWCRTDVKIM